MTLTVIHGAPATGKTRFAERFREHYHCCSVAEEWDPHGMARQRERPRPGSLVLTQCSPHVIRHFLGPVTIVSIDKALIAIGINPTRKHEEEAADYDA